MSQKNTITRALTLTAGALLAGQSASAFTTITNDGFNQNNVALPNDYGDNVSEATANYNVGLTGSVTGTPNIKLEFSGGKKIEGYKDWEGRGPVMQLEDEDTPTPFQIEFTPAASWAVEIQSFVLDEFGGADKGDMVVDWEVQDSGGGKLESGTWVDFSDANDTDGVGGRTIVSPDVTGKVGEALTLKLTRVSGDRAFLAMDDLTFAQVPEPSSVALALGAAALGLAASRRRGA